MGSPISSDADDTVTGNVSKPSAMNNLTAVHSDAEPVSPPGAEADAPLPTTPTDLPSGSPITPMSNVSAPDLLHNTEAISPDSRSSSRQEFNGGMETDSILLSPHTPPLPPKAYEKYIPSDFGKRKAQDDDDERRHRRQKKRSRKESESPMYVYFC